MNKILKIFLCFVSLCLLCMIGFFMLFVLAFAREVFYIVIAALTFLFLLGLIPYTFFGHGKRKLRRRLWLGLLCVILLSITGREAVRTYHNSFEKFGESSVDLKLYEPFRDGTLAVSLDSASTLKLSDSLPRLDGATAFYPVYSAFARAVYPENTYEYYDGGTVMCRTTRVAYECMTWDEDLNIIFVLEPSEEQLWYAQESNYELVMTPIGREAFVFFVNASNPVSGITSEELKGIYSGQINNWRDVGGKNRKIRAFQRDEGSGSQTIFRKFMKDSKIMPAPQRNIVGGMGPMIDMAADYTNYSNAIGFTFLHYAKEMVGNDGIKILAVDGVYPTAETIRSGEYPLVENFYAISRTGEKNPNVGLLIDWILSPQGQEIVEKSGYVSIDNGSDESDNPDGQGIAYQGK